MENTRKRSYYYVLTVFLGTFMMFLGTQSSAGFSIVVNSLKSTYNLTGTASSFIFTAKNICAFIFVMFANKYYEKLGLRVGIALSYVYGIIGLLILRISNGNLVLIYLAAVFIGAMYAFCMILPMALLIRTWFNKNRALCMAICSAGTGLSTYLLSPLLQKRIAAEGMNGAYNTLMIFFAAGAIVMFLLLRSKPSDVGLEIYGGEAKISGIYKTGSREVTYHCEGLENGTHTAKITVSAGKFGIDGMEVIGGELPYPAKEEETAAETEPETETETYAEAETSEATAEENKKSPALPIAAAAAAVIAAGAGAAILIKKKK